MVRPARSLLDGTTIPCACSTFAIGIVSGFLHEGFKKVKHRPLWALAMGVGAEVFHLAFAFFYLWGLHGVENAWKALRELIIPFILANAFGFALLILVFDQMRHYRDTEVHAQQVEGELGVATSIQNSMLPKIFPDYPGRLEFNIAASMEPAKEVGGDFFFNDNDHFFFLVADVSGKGVPAALFMVIAKTLIKNNIQSGLSLDKALEATNQQLLEGDDERMFVTAWVGGLEISTGKLTYVNCGHNPPLYCKAGGQFIYLRDFSGLILAASKKARYKTFELTMAPGDRIFLYTDGITEAMNAQSEQYGEKRLLALADSAPLSNTPLVALDAVKADVASFVKGTPQSDDMTMLALQFIDYDAHKKVEAKTENFEVLSAFLEEQLNAKKVPLSISNKLEIVLD